jgi:hypothetical protein
VARVYKPRDARQKKLNAAATRRYNKRNSEEIRSRRMQKTYGITSEQFYQMETVQEGRCACCGLRPVNGRGRYSKLVIDHCHTTGQVRALLCTNCNVGLGHFRDSIEALQQAIEYLRGQTHPEKIVRGTATSR